MNTGLTIDGETLSPKNSSEAKPARLKFWGVRGSIATPGPDTVFYGGNTSCVEVRTNGEIIILDAGTGIRMLGLALSKEFQNRPVNLSLLISHTHWDHIQGFPFFQPAYNPKNKIRILGFEGARQGLERTFLAQMESAYFPISLREMPSHIVIQELKEMDFNIGEVRVRAELANHPGICSGYRIYTSGGSVAYFPDIELSQGGCGTEFIKKSESEKHYLKVQNQKLVEFVRDVEVLIVDSQYDAVEYETHVGWGHSCIEDSVELALKANVKRLFLFHHDPLHNDEQVTRMVEQARAIAAKRGSSLIVDGAREGLEIILDPVKK